ncbi:MAG: Inner membrane ABC transporter permease protein YcjP [Spirochaetes bacterium ADurb.Bin315]|nr:MAG: Inner membrane ABC transporter permease protein YcjP [Spirochaetes bacterium ADurb.Bin315]
MTNKRTITYQTIIYVVCILLSVIVLVPFIMMFVNSFKGIRESALFRISLPKKPTLTNYKTVLSKLYFWRGMRNSLILSISVTLLVNFTGAMAAFVIQRKNGILCKWTYYALFAGIIIPVSIIPTIQLMMQTRIHNTYIGLILFYTAVNLPFTVFLLTGFMKTIPKEIDEAAMIEGCGPFRMFVQLIIPLLKTPLVTSTIVTITAVWNDFSAPFYLISDSKKWPIVISVYNFVSQYYTDWGTVFAFMTLVLLPVIIVYGFLQRYIIAGLTTGAVKG